MYKINEKVVYPMHGVGVISKIEEMEVLGETHLYYILKLSMTEMTVKIPVDKSDELGLRSVVSESEINEVYEVLKQDNPEADDDNWKNRYNTNQTKIKSGSITELAEVVRNLFIRNTKNNKNNKKELSASEKRLFDNALQLMIDEIALSKSIEKTEVEHKISEILAKSHSSEDSDSSSWEEK